MGVPSVLVRETAFEGDVVVSEARRQPVLEQSERDKVAVVADFQIAVVHQDIKHFPRTKVRVLSDMRVAAFEAAARAVGKHTLSGRLARISSAIR